MTARAPLIDVARLATLLAAGDICLLDASWHPVTAGRNALAEFEQAHIPSARFLDLAQLADPQSELAHTLPPPAHLASCAAAVGARRERQVVLYDDAGMAPSARAWWMLTTYGFNDVHVLDGGLRAWLDAGLEVERGASASLQLAAEDLPLPDARRLAGHQQVQRAIEAGLVVLDARSAARFRGDAAEPVEGIRSGHINGSINLPYLQLLDARTGGFAPDAVLREQFESAGVDLRRPVVCSCGSGVTACVLALALETLGHPAVSVYDGSWTDWAKRTSQGATS